MIRELHVYGDVEGLSGKKEYEEEKTQHTGLGKQLMACAE